VKSQGIQVHCFKGSGYYHRVIQMIMIRINTSKCFQPRTVSSRQAPENRAKIYAFQRLSGAHSCRRSDISPHQGDKLHSRRRRSAASTTLSCNSTLIAWGQAHMVRT
jgi:hypothetical protein